MGGGGQATAHDRQADGLRTLDLPFPMTIGDVATNMDRVAAALGDPATGTCRGSASSRRLQGCAAAAPRRHFPRRRREQRRRAVGRSGMDAAWRACGSAHCPAAARRWSSLQPARLPILLRSAYRRTERSLGQTWLEHPLAKPAQVTDRDRRRPALDLRRPADARRGRAAEAKPVRLLRPAHAARRRGGASAAAAGAAARGAGARSRAGRPDPGRAAPSAHPAGAGLWRGAWGSAAPPCRRCSPTPSPRPTSAARRAVPRWVRCLAAIGWA